MMPSLEEELTFFSFTFPRNTFNTITPAYTAVIHFRHRKKMLKPFSFLTVTPSNTVVLYILHIELKYHSEVEFFLSPPTTHHLIYISTVTSSIMVVLYILALEFNVQSYWHIKKRHPFPS